MDWEKKLLKDVMMASVKEQRANRRWGVFFKLLIGVYLFTILILYSIENVHDTSLGKPHTALIKINGVIMDQAEAGSEPVLKSLKAAYKDKKMAGIIIEINSPGGSPVQSAYIYDEIRRLKKAHEAIPVIAVITDIGASGGYYVACAADKIYANESSMVGSIGVLMDGFGFVDTLKLLGVERRLYTAGQNKGFLDPFTPKKAAEVTHIQTLLHQIHDQFIKSVKIGRGDRLKDEETVFSGLIWSGEQSLELGLIDGLGSSQHVAREVIKAEKIIDYTEKVDILDRFADRVGVSISKMWLQTLGLTQPSLK